MRTARAVGLVAGFAADRAFGDPRRAHPVAGFGRVAQLVEKQLYADSRSRGVLFAAAMVGSVAVAGVLVERATVRRPVAHALAVGFATWAVLGARSLRIEALAVGALVESGDIEGAREQVTHLVGRDPSELDGPELARATVESVAENSSDAVVAPLLAGAIAGIPGLLAYRAANTLDAMVGHHSPRYENFGWASARLDDVANLVPARLSALLAAACAPVVRGHPADALRAWSRDAAGHPSPNAGPVEAAFAGSLDITLGGRNVYGSRVEHRPEMGTGGSVAVGDIARSVRLADAVAIGALAVAVAVSAALAPKRQRLLHR